MAVAAAFFCLHLNSTRSRSVLLYLLHYPSTTGTQLLSHWERTGRHRTLIRLSTTYAIVGGRLDVCSATFFCYSRLNLGTVDCEVLCCVLIVENSSGKSQKPLYPKLGYVLKF